VRRDRRYSTARKTTSRFCRNASILTLSRSSSVTHPTPHSYTLHLTPIGKLFGDILHPTPHFPNPTPYTLRPKAFCLFCLDPDGHQSERTSPSATTLSTACRARTPRRCPLLSLSSRPLSLALVTLEVSGLLPRALPPHTPNAPRSPPPSITCNSRADMGYLLLTGVR